MRHLDAGQLAAVARAGPPKSSLPTVRNSSPQPDAATWRPAIEVVLPLADAAEAHGRQHSPIGVGRKSPWRL